MTLNHVLARSRVLLLSTVAALSLGSCADDDVGLVEGTVTLDGTPAIEVEVSLEGEGFVLFELTGRLGEFAFEVPPGMYTVRLRAGLPPNVECSPGLFQTVNITTEVTALADFNCDTRP